MSAGDDRSPSESSPKPVRDEDESLFTRFRTAQSGPLMFIREVLTSIATVALVGLLLFTISGVWPPMVAVESGSMEPHMQKGDLIFITEPGRFVPAYTYGDTGVVTYRIGKKHGYRSFGSYGSVIVYDNPQRPGPPIIHRARFYVEDGENWYARANQDYIRADDCAELLNCPAPHAGFITKGDANQLYDQANGISSPVKSEWIVGVARVRIPYLGWVRLGFSSVALVTPVDAVPGDQAQPGAVDASRSGPAASIAEPPGFDSTTDRSNPDRPTSETAGPEPVQSVTPAAGIAA